jgi:hypothetical protein
MLEYIRKLHQIIQSPLGYYNALVNILDVIAMPNSNPIFYVFKVFHIRIRPHIGPIPPLSSS